MKRVILLLFGSIVCSTPLYAKTWAAQLPYGAGELSPVFHADSRDKVLAKANVFCQQTELCRNRYAVDGIKTALATGVVGFNNLFVTTLCRQNSGDHKYVTVPSPYDDGQGREDGKQKGLKRIQEAGLLTEDCLIHAVYGVKSGRKLQANLVGQAIEKDSEISGTVTTKPRKIQRRNAIRTARESRN